MENTKKKAPVLNDKKMLNALVKEPTWSLIVCSTWLITSIITTIVLAFVYFGTENPLPVLLDLLILEIVNIVVLTVILIFILRVRFQDSLLEDEKILFVGEAPIWPVILCSFLIAINILCIIGCVILVLLPADSIYRGILNLSTPYLIITAAAALVETVALCLIASLLLKPKFFLTNKRIIGHTHKILRFPMYSSIPYSSITSVHVTCWHHLCVGTPSGELHFITVKNAVDAYKELLKMITASKQEAGYDENGYDEGTYDYYDYGNYYYAPSYPPYGYGHPYAGAPAHQARRTQPADFSHYKNGKPVKPKMPPKPRVPRH